MTWLSFFAMFSFGLAGAAAPAWASLGDANTASTLSLNRPEMSRPLQRPKAKPATIKKKQEPGQAPGGPPIKRGKGLV